MINANLKVKGFQKCAFYKHWNDRRNKLIRPKRFT